MPISALFVVFTLAAAFLAIESILLPSWSAVGGAVFSAAPNRLGAAPAPRPAAQVRRPVARDHVDAAESVIDRLSKIDRDIGRAIVSLTTCRAANSERAAAGLSVLGGQAAITVQPTPPLARVGIDLVPLPDGRALIALDEPTSVADLELLVFDLLDDAQLPAADRRIVEGIGSILRDARRSDEVALQQRSIIVIETNGNGRAARERRCPPAADDGQPL